MKWFCLVLLCSTMPVQARDPGGKYAQANPELHEWFEGLRSGKGPCCADADGNVVKDADWEAVNDPAKPDVHYKVRIPNTAKVGDPIEWVDVKDEAVVTVPNKYGLAVVWPYNGYDKDMGSTVIVRCFMPGAGI